MWQAIAILCISAGSNVDCSERVVAFADSAEACHLAALQSAKDLVEALNGRAGGGYAGMMVGCRFTGMDGES